MNLSLCIARHLNLIATILITCLNSRCCQKSRVLIRFFDHLAHHVRLTLVQHMELLPSLLSSRPKHHSKLHRSWISSYFYWFNGCILLDAFMLISVDFICRIAHNVHLSKTLWFLIREQNPQSLQHLLTSIASQLKQSYHSPQHILALFVLFLFYFFISVVIAFFRLLVLTSAIIALYFAINSVFSPF